MEKYYLEDIIKVIKDCEAVQDSGESTYFKEQEKISAYNEIVKIVGGLIHAEVEW